MREISTHGNQGLSSAGEFNALVGPVARVLAGRRWTLVTAESCTGGLIGGALTSVAGSSAWYLGGVITYSDGLKQSLLGVRSSTLRNHGAVSEATATEMATGARQRLKAHLAVSVTGIAGPGGAVPGKPVGRVWIAVASPTSVVATRHTFPGDRAKIRQATVRAALLSVIAAASTT